MAILSTLTLNNGLAIYTVDADPTSSGFAAATGSLVILEGSTNLYVKGSGGNTDWKRTPNVTETVTLTGSDTLTNKTITSGRYNQLNDTNGNTSLVLSAVSSAVNYLALYNGGTGAAPKLVATGTDTNISFQLESKGTGTINFQIGATYLMSLPVAAPGSNTYLKYDGASYIWDTVSGSSPAGSDRNIQINNAGSFGSATNFSYTSGGVLTIGVATAESTRMDIRNLGSPVTLGYSAFSQWVDDLAGYSQFNYTNRNAGNSASTDFVATADTGNDTVNFIDMGINSSTYNQAAFNIGDALDGYLYTNGGKLLLGTATNEAIVFHTGGTTSAQNRGGISGTGVWTINTSVIGTASMDVFNTVSTTVNAFGAGTTITLGATTGTMTLRNPTIVGSQTTQTLFNTTATTINFGGAATTWTVGATTGTFTLRNPTVVGNQTTATLWNTVATTVSFAGASTTLTIGGTPTGAVTHNYSTNATTTATTKTINFGTAGASGSTTNINIGSAVAGSTTVATIQGRLIWATPVRTSTSAPTFQQITPADTTLTLSTESIFHQVGGTSAQATVTRQWATGALTTQREVLFIAPTYGFVGASVITTAATVAINASPIAGTNATITDSLSFLVQAGRSKFVGSVSIGLAAGTLQNTSALLDLVSTTSALGLTTMTSAQRTSLGSPRDGLLLYQSDSTPALYARINSAWKDISSVYRAYQFSCLGSVNGTSAFFTKASDIAANTSNPSGVPTTSGGNPGVNNGAIDPYLIPKDATITSLRIKVVGAAVSTGTVGTPTVRIRVYRVDYSSRTQLGSDIDITISATGVGIFGNSSGDAFQTAISSALSISVSAGDLIGIEFINQSGDNGIAAISRMFAVLETTE